MKSLENLYLLFSSEDFYFLSPLSWVKRIEDRTAVSDELRVLNLTIHAVVGDSWNFRYRILLENDGFCLALAADSVAGIERVEAERLIPLEKPVINKKNGYLQAVVPMKKESRNILAYVLNMKYLIEKEDLWNI